MSCIILKFTWEYEPCEYEDQPVASIVPELGEIKFLWPRRHLLLIYLDTTIAVVWYLVPDSGSSTVSITEVVVVAVVVLLVLTPLPPPQHCTQRTLNWAVGGHQNSYFVSHGDTARLMLSTKFRDSFHSIQRGGLLAPSPCWIENTNDLRQTGTQTEIEIFYSKDQWMISRDL